eukprot:6205523-Pleurochrysis_carterae.AAC.4
MLFDVVIGSKPATRDYAKGVPTSSQLELQPDRPLPPDGVVQRPPVLTRTPLFRDWAEGAEAGGPRRPSSLTLSGPLPAYVTACGGGTLAVGSPIRSGGCTRCNPSTPRREVRCPPPSRPTLLCCPRFLHPGNHLVLRGMVSG